MIVNRYRSSFVLISLAILLSSCASSPPRHIDNLCHVFDEKAGWYKKAKKSQQHWGSAIPVMMSIMRQESGFRAKAKPPRTKILWIIPGPRLSSAYGYSQVKDETWQWYKKSSGNRFADRDEFDDAIDFIGWYNSQTSKRNGVKLSDTYNLYLAYHEGHGGYERGTYRNKPWLTKVARKVASRAQTYQKQLQGCEKRMRRGWWFF